MCSILGGTIFDERATKIFNRAKSRGKDFTGMKQIKTGQWIANHRAIPTTELESPITQQPFGSKNFVVHNGVIANDKDLGVKEGEVDSSVLPGVLSLDNIINLRDSLKQVVGSYAIGILKEDGNFFLACNFKPIWVAHFPDGHKFFSSLKQHFPDEWVTHARIYRVEPYSVTTLNSPWNYVEIPRDQGSSALVIASGGLDSTVVAKIAANSHNDVTLLHFQYGCNAEGQEEYSIEKIAEELKVNLEILDLPMDFAKDSTPLLQDDADIASGVEGTEYAHEWVPARNLLMLAMATSYAEAKGIGHIYLGTNLEEGGAYPDNEEQFIIDFRQLLWGAVQNGVKVEVHTPLGGLMKHEIVRVGHEIGAPMHLTHSCYTEEIFPCENCGPCFMRTTAFERNGLMDPLLVEKRIWEDTHCTDSDISEEE